MKDLVEYINESDVNSKEIKRIKEIILNIRKNCKKWSDINLDELTELTNLWNNVGLSYVNIKYDFWDINKKFDGLIQYYAANGVFNNAIAGIYNDNDSDYDIEVYFDYQWYEQNMRKTDVIKWIKKIAKTLNMNITQDKKLQHHPFSDEGGYGLSFKD